MSYKKTSSIIIWINIFIYFESFEFKLVIRTQRFMGWLCLSLLTKADVILFGSDTITWLYVQIHMGKYLWPVAKNTISYLLFSVTTTTLTWVTFLFVINPMNGNCDKIFLENSAIII